MVASEGKVHVFPVEKLEKDKLVDTNGAIWGLFVSSGGLGSFVACDFGVFTWGEEMSIGHT